MQYVHLCPTLINRTKTQSYGIKIDTCLKYKCLNRFLNNSNHLVLLFLLQCTGRTTQKTNSRNRQYTATSSSLQTPSFWTLLLPRKCGNSRVCTACLWKQAPCFLEQVKQGATGNVSSLQHLVSVKLDLHTEQRRNVSKLVNKLFSFPNNDTKILIKGELRTKCIF